MNEWMTPPRISWTCWARWSPPKQMKSEKRMYLYHRIYITIQRFNAVLLHDTFSCSNDPDLWPPFQTIWILTFFFSFNPRNLYYRGYLKIIIIITTKLQIITKNRLQCATSVRPSVARRAGSRVTWRHRARDHLILEAPFPIGVPL